MTQRRTQAEGAFHHPGLSLRRGTLVVALCWIGFVQLGFAAASQQPPEQPVTILSTPGGFRFGIIGQKDPTPSPTLLIFSASSFERTFQDPNINRMGLLMRRTNGFLLVSMDLPCHGADQRPNEPAGLAGWYFRLRNGENFVPDFLARASSVLDYLISQGYTDPQRIAVYGISRGGFMAFQFAGAEPRVRWVVAFAPVTNLLALSEFSSMWNNAATRSLALTQIVDRLVGRAIWMCIGNLDDRVNTDDAIAFARRFVEAAQVKGQFPDLTIEFQPTIDHAILPDSHDKAAAWLRQRLEKPFVPPR